MLPESYERTPPACCCALRESSGESGGRRRPVRIGYPILSPESRTNGRPPEVSSTAFSTQTPDLQPVHLMDGLRDHVPARPAPLPLIRFLYIASYFCSTLLSDPASRRRPCTSLSLRLHQAVKRTFTFELSNMLGTHRKPPAGTGGSVLYRRVQLTC